MHPLVRTNPVTGWKSIFAVGNFPKYINELDPEESEDLLRKFYCVILENHDLQVRFKWRKVGDIGMSHLIYPLTTSVPTLLSFNYLERKSLFQHRYRCIYDQGLIDFDILVCLLTLGFRLV